MSATAAAPAGIKLFWKPGCSSCLRTKEFLVKQGIGFESVNAEGNPAALAELKALGARGLPVISLGNRFTLCQSFGQVLKFPTTASWNCTTCWNAWSGMRRSTRASWR